VQASAALNDPAPVPAAVHSLFRFLARTTGAQDGVLIVRGYDADRDPPEIYRVYDMQGALIEGPLAPFARSIAGGAVSLQEPCAMTQPDRAAAAGSLELHPFEKGRRSLLAAPLSVAPGLQVVLELFDKDTPDAAAFTDADRRLAAAAADFGAEMLRQALAERQTQRVLFDAVEAALAASDSMAESLRGASARPDDPPPEAVLERLKDALSGSTGAAMDAGETLRLAEAVRVLALRHGPSAVRHCTEMTESLRRLLDEAAGVEEARL
jgi:hypothetical protein